MLPFFQLSQFSPDNVVYKQNQEPIFTRTNSAKLSHSEGYFIELSNLFPMVLTAFRTKSCCSLVALSTQNIGIYPPH